MNRLMAATLIAGFAFVISLQAHDASKHKGKATTGEVLSVAADSFEMKTSAGTIKVSFTGKTKFEHGKAVVDKTHLKKGDNVSAIGTKLPSGEIVAKEILLGVSTAPNKMDHSKMAPGAKPAADHK